MKKYEAIVILDDRKVEGNGNNFVKEIEAAVAELGGTNITSDCLGRKQFAAPIQKRNAGTYWDMMFDLEETKVAALKDRYKLVGSVLRLEVFIYDKPEITVIKKNRPEEAVEA